MSGWHTGGMVAWDLETTSPDPETARIVTAAVVIIRPGREPEIHRWLVNPGVPIPPEATKVHGVTDEQAQSKGEDPQSAVTEIAELLGLYGWDGGLPVVAFNHAYDGTVLDRELRRNGRDPLDAGKTRPVVDPFVIDKAVDQWRKGRRKLGDLCTHYGARLDDAHTSDGDALAVARLAWQMAQRFSEIRQANLLELHEQQVKWSADDAKRLADWYRKEAGHLTALIEAWKHEKPTAEQVRDSMRTGGRRCNQRTAERLAGRLADAEPGVDVAAALIQKADQVDGAWPLRPWTGKEPR